jgi:hypothetical protein
MGPKMQDFCPIINMLKGNPLKTILWWIMVCQKVPKLYVQSQLFNVKNQQKNFQKNSLKNINLGVFVKNIFFLTFIFKHFISKFMPYFWRTGAPRILKIQWYPLSTLIFGQKSEMEKLISTDWIFSRCQTGFLMPG